MKSLLAVALVGLAIVAQADTAKLIAKIDGKQVGTVTYTTKTEDDHSWTDTFIMKLQINGSTIENSVKVHFSPEGRGVQDDEKETVDGEVKTDETTKFTATSAEITDNITGDKKTFDAPSGPPTLDPSDSWWVKVKPSIGDKATASSFSKEEGWHTTTVSYVSDKPFKLGDKTVTGHLIHHEHPKDSYDELVDDQGLPLEVDIPGTPAMHFERSPYTDL